MYSKKVLKFLKKNKIKAGDEIRVTTMEEETKGLLINRPDYMREDTLIVKLDNGYNIGINLRNVKKAELVKKSKNKKEKKVKKNIPKKPFISILHTGGTIASKVDYRTGGVVSRFNPEELIKMFPELKNYGRIHSVFISNMFSEDMRFAHYKIIAEYAKKEVLNGSSGIIITHGTDTMGYTAAALSFMFENLPIPVILVGAQRSSDRGSSDAEMNLICAAKFIKKTDYRGVAVCMHETINDDTCVILPGVNVRKMHTSRRDAFKTVNDEIIARVEYQDDDVTFISEYEKTTDKKGEFKVLTGMQEKVGIIKMHPNINPDLIKYYEEKKYKGLIIEGTGLGHAPVNEIDKHTKKNKKLLKNLKRLVGSGCVVVMTSQCINGAVNMKVYSSGRDLLNAGVVSGEGMLSETALVKLSWLLANKKKQAKKLIGENLKGEIKKRLIV